MSRWRGGAIKTEIRTLLTISDSTFIGNSAAQGGAIYHRGNELVVQRSTFDSNVAKVSVGQLPATDDLKQRRLVAVSRLLALCFHALFPLIHVFQFIRSCHSQSFQQVSPFSFVFCWAS